MSGNAPLQNIYRTLKAAYDNECKVFVKIFYRVGNEKQSRKSGEYFDFIL